MADPIKLKSAYMRIAYEWAKLSNAHRRKVGAILVKDGRIISCGFNGTPKNYHTNECEDPYGKTRVEVLHAESNAILKVATSTDSTEGSVMYTTCFPCFECAKLIVQAGIYTIFYAENYQDDDEKTLDFLKECNVTIHSWPFKR